VSAVSGAIEERFAAVVSAIQAPNVIRYRPAPHYPAAPRPLQDIRKCYTTAAKETSGPCSRGARRRSGGQGIFLDLLHGSERTGTQGQRPRGPIPPCGIAQGASPGSRKPSCSREPQRGERKGLDAGTLPGSAAPSGA
jgi:hypothetical protein